MVEIVYRVLIKKGHESAFLELAEKVLIPEAQKIPGNKVFSLFQNGVNKREFIFYEKWDNEQDVLTYKRQLIASLGSPRPGEEFPEKMNRLIEEDEDLI